MIFVGPTTDRRAADQSESCPNRAHDCAGWAVCLDGHGIGRCLERVDLAVQQGRGHEVSDPGVHAPSNHLSRGDQVYEEDAFISVMQFLPVAFP